MMQSFACPDLHVVRSFATGELPEAEAELFEQHVLTCSICAEKLDALQSSDPFTKELRDASGITLLEDRAMDELIERLVRTPPDAAMPASQRSDESIAEVRKRRLDAAEARRQALVAKARDEPGGSGAGVSPTGPLDNLLALDEALTRLEAFDSEAASLFLLRYFARLTLDEAAAILGLSAAATDRLWAFAKAWLHRELQGGSHSAPR